MCGHEFSGFSGMRQIERNKWISGTCVLWCIYYFGHLAKLAKTERGKCEIVIENNLEELVPISEQRSWMPAQQRVSCSSEPTWFCI